MLSNNNDFLEDGSVSFNAFQYVLDDILRLEFCGNALNLPYLYFWVDLREINVDFHDMNKEVFLIKFSLKDNKKYIKVHIAKIKVDLGSTKLGVMNLSMSSWHFRVHLGNSLTNISISVFFIHIVNSNSWYIYIWLQVHFSDIFLFYNILNS